MSRTKRTPESIQRIPRFRIAEPKGRPPQVRYPCPIEKRKVRISVGSRDFADAERTKAEIEAKLLFGIDVKSEKAETQGPEMDWDSFREQYRLLHLAAVRDITAEDAESRLDIAESITQYWHCLGDSVMGRLVSDRPIDPRVIVAPVNVTGSHSADL